MKKVKIGVIGTGHLGKIHAKLFTEIKNCELVGIYDKDFETAKKVGAELSINPYSNLDEMLENIDAVDVAATTSAHYELVKKAFSKNKHAFVEKPITT